MHANEVKKCRLVGKNIVILFVNLDKTLSYSLNRSSGVVSRVTLRIKAFLLIPVAKSLSLAQRRKWAEVGTISLIVNSLITKLTFSLPC